MSLSSGIPPGRVALDRYDGLMDAECVELCDALNRLPGIRTIESCCGHGDYPYRIWLMADSLDALPALAYWFDRCHCGAGDWRVVVTTDCGMNPVKFLVEGPIGAYSEALKIASLIEAAS